MKTITQKVIFYVFIISFVFITSCRTEETEFIQAPADEVLMANSSVASLMQKTTTNDGSMIILLIKLIVLISNYRFQYR